MPGQGLSEQQMEAQLRRADARLQLLQADADARKAKGEIVEISGLTKLRERVRQALGELKQRTSESRDEVRQKTESMLHELQAEIERVSERYSVWDAARERRFDARLREAEAKVKLWKARAEQKGAEREMQLHDTLVDLEEKIELARSRFANWRAARHDSNAEAEFAKARQHFNYAFDAAQREYEP